MPLCFIQASSSSLPLYIFIKFFVSRLIYRWTLLADSKNCVIGLSVCRKSNEGVHLSYLVDSSPFWYWKKWGFSVHLMVKEHFPVSNHCEDYRNFSWKKQKVVMTANYYNRISTIYSPWIPNRNYFSPKRNNWLFYAFEMMLNPWNTLRIVNRYWK